MLTKDRIQEIDKQEKELHDQAHKAIEWLFEVQGLNAKLLAANIDGVAASTWASYARLGHEGKRTLPTIAALSWYSQIPIEAFFLGNKAAEAWVGFDYSATQLAARLGRMPTKHFINTMELFCDVVGVSPIEIGIPLEELAALGGNQYLMPSPLDFKKFKHAYTTALSFGLRNFRKTYDLGIDSVAEALNVSPNTYRNMENPEKNSKIEMQLAFRLEKAFGLNNTTALLGDMGEFEGYRRSQGIRHAKATAIYRLHKHLKPEHHIQFDAYTKTATILFH
ncbi:MAG: helix-turn-helix transcriptional regulator [Agarilytica sp.]